MRAASGSTWTWTPPGARGGTNSEALTRVYRLCANEYSALPNYFPRCWQTGADVESGKTMKLTAGQVIVGKRIALMEGGTISGVVNGSGPSK